MKRCVNNYSQKALLDVSRLALNTFLNIHLVSHFLQIGTQKTFEWFFKIITKPNWKLMLVTV